MSPSVRVRFEVFKRDRFTCAYCGRTPPDALLEIDHVIPRAAGGSDEMDNLVTACWECNHGKSDRLLDEGSAPITRQTVEEAQERVLQAQAYAESVQSEKRLQDQFRWEVISAWGRYFGADLVEQEGGGLTWHFDGQYFYGRFPNEASLRRILRRLPVDEVLEAVDITASKFRYANENAERYFFGICWRKIDARDSR